MADRDPKAALATGTADNPYVNQVGQVAAPAFVGTDGNSVVLDCLESGQAKPVSIRVAGTEVASISATGVLSSAPPVPSYGETTEFNETGSAIALTSSASSYRWITGAAGVVKGAGYVTWDDAAAPTGKRLVIGASGAGKYLVMATFAGNLAAHADLSMDIYKNAAAAPNITCDFHVTEDNSYVAGSASGLLTLAAGDTVSMWFTSSTNTNTFTLKHGNITLVRVGT